MRLPLRGWLVLGALALSAVLAYGLWAGGAGRAPTTAALAPDTQARDTQAEAGPGVAPRAADEAADDAPGQPTPLAAAPSKAAGEATVSLAAPKKEDARPVTGVGTLAALGAGSGGGATRGLGRADGLGLQPTGGSKAVVVSPRRDGNVAKPAMKAKRKGRAAPESAAPPAESDGWDIPSPHQAPKTGSRELGAPPAAQALALDATRTNEPASFLPRTFYFENTYLGGDAAIAERTRRVQRALRAEGIALPLELATTGAQDLDPPATDGLAVYADLDRPWLEQPGRVVLQVALRGSDRYGWRRPPLDVVVVFAPGAGADDPRGALQTLASLAQRLGPRDRLGAVVAGAGRGRPGLQGAWELEPLRVGRGGPARLRDVGRAALSASAKSASPRSLPRALRRARGLFERASQAEAVVPGTRLVLLVTGPRGLPTRDATRAAADALARHGAMVSVLELSERTSGAWWQVAAAGHGSYRHAAGARVDEAVARELADQSRVVARLVRLNIRLAKGVQAIRVLGSRVLDPREVARVKAREEAVDRQLSASVGVRSDRGEDDDGIQTVIPYFYGGDAHVVLVELWVERPGPVADVTIKYKDMVNLDNATARASATLAGTPRATTPVARGVLRNARGMRMAELLQRAGFAMAQGREALARALVAKARAAAGGALSRQDRALLEAAEALVRRGASASTAPRSEALVLAGLRRAGAPEAPPQAGEGR